MDKKKQIVINPGETNELLSSMLDELKSGNKNRNERWDKQVSWHKWGNLFGFITLLFSIVNVMLVGFGLYFYPEETRNLFNTVLKHIGLR